MATLKNTTVPDLAITGNATATNPITQSAPASSANHLTRKTEMDAALTAKADTSDARFTDARAPTGTATGGEITGTFPNSLVVADRTVNDSLATPANTGPLTSLFSWIGGRLKAITGKSDWITAPATTLELAATHIANVTGNPHVVTKAQIGLTTVTDDAQLKIASNLSDLANAATARTSLGLGTSAVLNTGTSASTVALGDDSRFTNSRTPLVHAPTHKLSGTDPIRLDEFALPTASVAMNGQRLTGLGTPLATTDAATKSYVDVARGSFKVRVVADSNISLSGIGQVIDGVTVADLDRIAATGQMSATENGVWVANAGPWGRAADADSGTEFNAASLIAVSEGTLYADSVWIVTANDPITLGATAITIARYPLAGAGLGHTDGHTLKIAAAGVTDAMVGSRTVNQALATPGNSGVLTSILSWLAGAIKAATGKTNWYDTPDTTLALAATHIANVTTNPHAVTKTNVGLSAVSNDAQLKIASNLIDLASVATARTNLGLGGAALLAVGTTAGTVAAGDDSRFTISVLTGGVVWVDQVNGVDATGARGNLKKPFLTLGAAKTAAVFGDTIYVMPGDYTEKDLLKDGVNWFFFAGATVSYNGPGNGAIFDDGANGANVDIGCRIDGVGLFIRNSGGLEAYVLNITRSGSSVVMNGGVVFASSDYALRISNCTLARVTLAEGAGGIFISGGSRTDISMKLMDGSGVRPALKTTGGTNVIAITELYNLIGAANTQAVDMGDGDTTIYAGTLYTADLHAVRMRAQVTSQKCRINNCRIQTRAANTAARAVYLDSSNLILESCSLLAHPVSTYSIEGSGAFNVRLYGSNVANIAKAVNVTELVGTLTVDANVI